MNSRNLKPISPASKRRSEPPLRGGANGRLQRVHLPVFEFDRHRPAPDRQLDLDLDRILGLPRLDDLFDLPFHVLEGAVADADLVADLELNLDDLARAFDALDAIVLGEHLL